ncbi:MFS transporter [Saccharibacillus sp. O23]|uniref:MDR family MFS transporter n=1 Tax=Saccharibacillus sp. O23 TaxID=2009338 RepID=UPI000B4E70BB|nr:MDR family MFS transporter [Saccharibacillus sp. O23]OWR27178.1 MFS transporter [Saccharibacillus sp. O23]
MNNGITAARPALQTGSRVLVLIGLIIGLIFSELDETVVSTAMPTIVRDLHGLSFYGWVAGIYMLAVTVFMPILGKLADLYGRKRIYLTSMGLFIAGSLMCGISPSMGMLLAGRCVQGIGAGGLMPLALVIIGESFPLEQRAKIQGLIGPLMILPQLVGPVVGGYFVGHLNWHWVFFINIPLGLLAAVILFFSMRESRSEESNRSIDWLGAAMLVASLLSLLLAPVMIDNLKLSWSSPLIVGMLVLSAVFAALFVQAERRAAEPIIPLSLFRNRNFVTLSLIVMTLMLALMGSFASFPYFAQHVMGLTPTASGYLMMAAMAGAIPSSMLNSFLITKVAYRKLFVVFMFLPLIGLVMLMQLTPALPLLYVLIAFFVMGVGMGILFGSDNLIIQESVDPAYGGVAVSSVQLFQSIGATIGLSVFGSLLAKHIRDGIHAIAGQLPAGSEESVIAGALPESLSSSALEHIRGIIASSFDQLFAIGLGFAIVAYVLCWFLSPGVLGKSPKQESAAASRTE